MIEFLVNRIQEKVAEIGPAIWLWLGIVLVLFIICCKVFQVAKQMRKHGEL